MKTDYVTQYEDALASAGTFTISGRVGRTVQLVHTLINGTGVETIDGPIIYNTSAGDAITCKALTQVTSASGAPTQQDFNDQDTETFPIVINENESLVFTLTASAAGAMKVAATLKIDIKD